MFHIAIVEDTQADFEQLKEHICRYREEKHIDLEITHYPNALRFLQEYRGEYELILMDIDMPLLNGMEAAKRLREIDPCVMLIFVTALARYAVNGYEVNAMDFIVKPIQYPVFASKLTRALQKMTSGERKKLLVRSGDKSVRIYEDEIYYVDIQGHVLTFHTERQNVTTRGSMKDVTAAVSAENFAMCNKSTLLNIDRIEQITGDEVIMDNGDRISASRPRKTEFMQRIADYYSHKKVNMGRF